MTKAKAKSKSETRTGAKSGARDRTSSENGRRSGAGAGLGSVYQRADGRWVAAVRVNGRKVVRYATNRAEARERLRALVLQAAQGRLSPGGRLTLADWVERWLALVAPERRPSTLRTYRQVLAPVLAELGRTRLSRLSPTAVSLALSNLRRRGMGSRRLQLAHATLRTCLAAAVRLGEPGLADNPLERVPKPRHTPMERRVWTQAELQRFVAVAAESPLRYAPLLLLLLGSGLRLGEALALTWDDVTVPGTPPGTGDGEPGQGVAHVTKSLTWAGGAAHLGPPKSRAGARTVTLPPVVVAALRRLPRPLDGGPLFRTAGGRPPGQSVLRQTMRALCERAGVPVVRLHDLRHLHASMLLADGVAVPAVAARLGHGSPGVTLAVYGHHLRRRDDAEDPAVSAMRRWLGPAGPPAGPANSR